MDLEKIEIRKIFFKKSGFRSSKTIIFIILWYQSSPSRSQTELLTIPLMKRCFEKNGAAKDSHFKKKNQFEKKKNMGSSRVQGSGLQFGMIPFFLPPTKSQFMSVILSPCLFPVINP